MAEPGVSQPSERSPLLSHDQNGNGHTTKPTDPDLPGADTSADETPTVLADEPSVLKLSVVLGSIWLGVFLAAIDGTIIATLAASISTSFHSLSSLSWLVSAYFIANAALQPIAGRLTDIFSRRWGLIFSNVFFGVGTLICGLARSEGMMIFGRVVAGIGGGGLTAIATFVCSDLVPLRKRGVIQGVGNLFYGAGSGLGGVIGGWINDVWGWRVAFLVQIPFIVVSCILVFFTVKIPVKKSSTSRLRRIDYGGALTLIIAIVLLLFGINSGGNTVRWTHPLVLVCIPLAFVFLAFFVYIELRLASEPIIPIPLLLDRTVASACLTNWFANMAWFALIYYVPIWIQLRGHSTTAAGARLIPCSVGGAIGSLGTGFIMKATGRYYWLSCGIGAILLAAFGATCSFSLTSPDWPSYLYFFAGGLGFGGMLTVTLLALIAAVPHESQAIVTSASYMFRNTGGILGVTITSAVYQNVLDGQLTRRLAGKKGAADVIERVKEDFGEIWRLSEWWKAQVQESYMNALSGVFVTAFSLSVLGVLASLWMKEHKLHSNLARK
ncbi:MAG: hypothetical protein M1814_004761 [Vezdaea aestivalis]|nr:MAG: hypothetical protein M1814_004761 [Vezdaea aestivalis]